MDKVEIIIEQIRLGIIGAQKAGIDCDFPKYVEIDGRMYLCL